MIKKVNIGPHDSHVFGNPAPLGLLGLAIASFCLVPMSFGVGATKEGLLTAAIFALLFGGGCQMLTGLMDFANKNAFGGAIFTTFAFMWIKNAVELYLLAQGVALSHELIFFVDLMLFFAFLILTYGFGFFSTSLFIFLVDIDMIYVCKIVKFTTHSPLADKALGVFTFLMGAIALWIAFASLINPVAGVNIFKDGPPVFRPRARKDFFDFTIRNSIFTVLYEYWRERAYVMMPFSELEEKLKDRVGGRSIIPDLFYLRDYGALVMTFSDASENTIEGVRLNSSGIDLYEQLILKKYEF